LKNGKNGLVQEILETTVKNDVPSIYALYKKYFRDTTNARLLNNALWEMRVSADQLVQDFDTYYPQHHRCGLEGNNVVAQEIVNRIQTYGKVAAEKVENERKLRDSGHANLIFDAARVLRVKNNPLFVEAIKLLSRECFKTPDQLSFELFVQIAETVDYYNKSYTSGAQ
jgi:hypothetical protein